MIFLIISFTKSGSNTFSRDKCGSRCLIYKGNTGWKLENIASSLKKFQVNFMLSMWHFVESLSLWQHMWRKIFTGHTWLLNITQCCTRYMLVRHNPCRLKYLHIVHVIMHKWTNDWLKKWLGNKTAKLVNYIHRIYLRVPTVPRAESIRHQCWEYIE